MVVGFLYTLSGGMLMVLGTGRPAEIAWRFIRLVGLIAFALSIGATLWTIRDAGWRVGASTSTSTWLALGCALGAAILAVGAPVVSRGPRAFLWGAILAGAMGAAAGNLIALEHATTSGGWSPPLAGSHTATLAFFALMQFLAAFMLGSITVAWLLGHAYLTQTRMTIAPLRHFSGLLWSSTVARIGLLLISVLIGWWAGVPTGRSLADASQSAWLILSLRVGLGLLAVGIFAYMVRQCVALRATQSATGILYFASIFAYIGELANQHLIADVGWSF